MNIGVIEKMCAVGKNALLFLFFIAVIEYHAKKQLKKSLFWLIFSEG